MENFSQEEKDLKTQLETVFAKANALLLRRRDKLTAAGNAAEEARKKFAQTQESAFAFLRSFSDGAELASPELSTALAQTKEVIEKRISSARAIINHHEQHWKLAQQQLGEEYVNGIDFSQLMPGLPRDEGELRTVNDLIEQLAAASQDLAEKEAKVEAARAIVSAVQQQLSPVLSKKA
ncbi:hypothetical protein BU26DRAFT_177972 [Trematosphaeria pertusa]|uniref:Uncharacterized protein n=1 Tax=Trematosphaeria pertusa TaxID=390896 RepID=A0A6A6HTU2_9PLEO|nr:uncharacterized protein BU26DRAFT_177972 [Trematosphaeria pertusa]KAF2241431.1 hypothetical protein BU26DRAFT_177972 [Trematosphaeria pertusa]